MYERCSLTKVVFRIIYTPPFEFKYVFGNVLKTGPEVYLPFQLGQ